MTILAVVIAASIHTVSAVAIAVMALFLLVLTWWHGSALASRAVDVVEAEASALGLVRLDENDEDRAA